MKFEIVNSRSRVLRGGDSAIRAGWGKVGAGRSESARAFTLLEVMIATGILFMCLFAILAVVSGSLRNARALQHRPMDASTAASMLYVQLTQTNHVTEGLQQVDFEDLDPDYSCEANLYQAETNGLCAVDVEIRRRSDNQVESKMSFLVYLPNFQQTALGSGGLR